jgi:hypothetical protein
MRLICKRLPQRTAHGGLYERGGFRTCAEKVELVIDAVRTESEPFIYSDCDVRFYDPVADDLLKQLGDDDIAFQNDADGGACAGFFIVRPSPHMHQFFRDVLSRTHNGKRSDQEAMNEILNQSGIRWRMLSKRYWTVGHQGHHWQPGEPVNPPANILVHHGNWTIGVENKLALLKAVRKAMARTKPSRSRKRLAPHMIERHPMGATAAVTALLAQERAKATAVHDPLPLAIVIQFWKGDKREALALARLLADIEPAPREDVGLVLARQSNCQLTADIIQASVYCAQKFPRIAHHCVKVPESVRYPEAAFLLWSETTAWLAEEYYSGRSPFGDFFTVEADGGPLSTCWIDRLKKAHRETRLQGKRVTGPRISTDPPHVNGTMIIGADCRLERTSLNRCPPAIPWDIFHAHTLCGEVAPSTAIASYYGMQGGSDSVWWSMSTITAWVTSVKDSMHQRWARRNLVKR